MKNPKNFNIGFVQVPSTFCVFVSSILLKDFLIFSHLSEKLIWVMKLISFIQIATQHLI